MNLFNNFLEKKYTTIVLSVLIFICSLVALHSFKQVEYSIKSSTNATLFSKHMAQSSDDLTNYARYYVITKRDEWKLSFNKVLDIRDGKIEDENKIKKSFKDRVKEQNFTPEEVDLLLKAEQLSNNLAKLEVQAFDLVQKFKQESATNVNTEYLLGLSYKAQELVFGEEYKKYKKEIMDTTEKFYQTVLSRMNNDYKHAMFIAWTSIVVTNLTLILLVLSAISKSKNTNSIKSNQGVNRGRNRTKTTKSK